MTVPRNKFSRDHQSRSFHSASGLLYFVRESQLISFEDNTVVRCFMEAKPVRCS